MKKILLIVVIFFNLFPAQKKNTISFINVTSVAAMGDPCATAAPVVGEEGHSGSISLDDGYADLYSQGVSSGTYDPQVYVNDIWGLLNFDATSQNNYRYDVRVIPGTNTMVITDLNAGAELYRGSAAEAYAYYLQAVASTGGTITISGSPSSNYGQNQFDPYANLFPCDQVDQQPNPWDNWTDPTFPWPDTGGGDNPPKDCAGVVGGTAYKDTCGICVAGTTGKQPCICPTDANFTVTKDMLTVINPNGNKDHMDSVLKYINLYKDDADFEINTRLRLAHFLAQITAETDGFLDVNLSEDYHYKKEALLKMKKLFDTTNVNGYVNCLCVFDRMYCCKNENGDEASKDGSKYRGHGVIQLTWKEDYRKFTEYYQNKFNDYSVNFVTNPELLTTNFKYSVLAAMWEACKQKKLNTYADNDDVLSYSRGINLGDPNSTKTPNGKTKRENNLKSAKKTLCLNF